MSTTPEPAPAEEEAPAPPAEEEAPPTPAPGEDTGEHDMREELRDRLDPDVPPADDLPDDHHGDDAHTPPLDNPDDARLLDRDDPRRLEVERERGRPFDQEAPEEEAPATPEAS